MTSYRYLFFLSFFFLLKLQANSVEMVKSICVHSCNPIDLLQKNFKSYGVQHLSHETKLMGIDLFYQHVCQPLCNTQQRSRMSHRPCSQGTCSPIEKWNSWAKNYKMRSHIEKCVNCYGRQSKKWLILPRKSGDFIDVSPLKPVTWAEPHTRTLSGGAWRMDFRIVRSVAYKGILNHGSWGASVCSMPI